MLSNIVVRAFINTHFSTFVPYQNHFSTKASIEYSRGSGNYKQQKVVQDMLFRIRKCNECPPSVQLLNFFVDNEKVGKVTKSVAEILCSACSPPVFELQEMNVDSDEEIFTISSEVGTNLESRTNAVMSAMTNLRSRGIIKGWRDELYPVCTNYYAEPKFLVERAAAPFLGIQQFGVHLNGLVIDDNISRVSGFNSSSTRMWIARRSPTKSKYPGMLDHIVAGGQPHGLSIKENLIKECEEEAGIPSNIATQCQPAGAINYQTLDPITINDTTLNLVSRSVLFCYDLVLPYDFVPTIIDGEVQHFFKWTLDEVAESMSPDFVDPIKPNCYLVIIDFLLRMGYLSPDTKGYLEVLRGLRNEDCA